MVPASEWERIVIVKQAEDVTQNKTTRGFGRGFFKMLSELERSRARSTSFFLSL